MGGYTSFYNFMYESYYLTHKYRKGTALAYLLVSLVMPAIFLALRWRAFS